MEGIEVVELAVEGAGDARSMVELEEAYAMLGQVGDSREKREGRRREPPIGRKMLRKSCRVGSHHCGRYLYVGSALGHGW